ncbi:GTP binding protein (Bud4), putative [Talaromyces stipitatus ATCC 10500]|uniref:GTP binding protein (Bud4), putative n=1 Tax=Talaromyces stipitatus (strain ATCC 10500 / CBS 375.48 / QM 6759 / NRRL 1006) TaxID=441959 RepID=B8M1I2_TALSN|nr:GTP binding protein (Bud4), putative [Talaromyces stipitatus ATCC 10500]EED21878.1 GTP binding protein (Bud4), putative [Talaromyces stipitatus ATCC 10500]
MASNTPRPLSELSPMAQRRNSPSWNKTNKFTLGSSPFDSSPFNNSTSKRLFWQDRESSFASLNSENAKPYDPEVPYSPTKRASIENLKRASRVKNSSLIAREQNTEYDPSHISVPERPLATGRSFHSRSQSDVQSPRRPAEGQESPNHRPLSPSKDQPSPPKSSLSKATRFGHKLFDPESDIWSDIDGGPSRFSDRNPKSVTFDAAPPQVNEYEMTTPDISSLAESREGSYEFDEDEIDTSFDRGSSLDRDDSFDASLEDIEKTPVVLPEDWRFMSPDSANDDLVSGDEDPFTDDHGSPTPDVHPATNYDASGHSRIDSLDSNGEKRPLPPLPSARSHDQSARTNSPDKLSAVFERVTSGQRGLPSPPGPASYSKDDIVGSGRPSMNLEDRLRLMMLQERDDNDQQQELEQQKERRMRRAGAREKSVESEYEDSQPSMASQVDTPPRISREDILRNLKSREELTYDDEDDNDDEGYEYSSQINSSPPQHMEYDPDVPIPSLEDHLDDGDVQIKDEPLSDDDGDVYNIPEYFGPNAHGLPLPSDEDRLRDDADDESNYSRNSGATIKQEREFSAETSETDATTVNIQETEEVKQTVEYGEARNTGAGSSNGFEHLDFGLEKIPEPLQRPSTPEMQMAEMADEPSTPDSVIRHPVDEESGDEQSDYESTPEPVPDLVATIKAPGTGLKTRPSLTPADIQSMAAVRRKVSVQSTTIPVPEAATEDTQEDANEQEPSTDEQSIENPPSLAVPEVSQRQSSLVKLDIPFTGTEESLEFGLDKEFDRVIEAQKVAFELALSKLASTSSTTPNPQGNTDTYPSGHIGELDSFPIGISFANKSSFRQRGYLMRQNTKVIIATSSTNDEPQTAPNDTASKTADGKPTSTPRKASQPTWTAEPWNGKTRRQSAKGLGVIKRKNVPGAVPPLPGTQSNVQDVQQSIDEAETEHLDDDQERGRLFVKVVGVRDLDMPLPKGEKLQFSLTLDNGLHCVTTSWLELGRSAPIGQEFELIVHKDLEFQLTLQMKTEGTLLKQTRQSVVSSISSPSKQKTSAFSRVFASPKKRKEMEMKQQLEQQEKQRQEAKANAGPWEKLRSVVDRDGSFARAYVALSDHEKYAFGRPYVVRVPCFNEWATEEPSSVKSKKSSTLNIVQKRPPYKIGNLELQLLFVPLPKGAKEEDMPKSMNACIREMREAENTASRTYEGYLSQQGGDCPFWRRRFFRLRGSKLTSYHETTRQARATINLAKAVKLIDDRSTLTQKETSTRGGGRRKSGFSEEEEGYMFVEEGFRIRFGNGEVIDFYADSRPEKEGWLNVLSETVGKGHGAGSGQIKAWTELVLKYEQALNAKREALDRLMGPNGQQSQPSQPSQSSQPKQQAPPPARPRHQHNLSQPEVRSPDNRREKTRSLIF